MFSIDKVKSFFKGNIMISEPLNKYTTIKIGGPADYFVEPLDREDLINLIKYLNEINYPKVIIGTGSNILISDSGFRGCVINLEHGFNKIKVEDTSVYAEAGVKLSKLVDVCLENSLIGIETLAGIPGTLGGAIVMNAGAYGTEISNYITSVEVLVGEKIKKLTKLECGFGYRKSNLEKTIIISANFILPEGDKEKAKERRREFLKKRKESQPVDLPNAGSIFKNPQGMFAGKLIEDAGLKGLIIGGAKVSEKHGNFIVNFNNATSDDVINLINVIQKEVYKKFGIKLELEIKLLGFKNKYDFVTI